MASYNKVILMGNLTRDPQLSYLPSQTPVVDFGLAINRKWKDQQGQMREDVCFVDCRTFGKQAETINQYMRKGRSLMVEGRLEFDQWEAQDGSKRSKHRVFVERFTFVDSRPGGGGSPGEHAGSQQQPPPQAAPPAGGGQPPAQQPNAYEAPAGGEDIPF